MVNFEKMISLHDSQHGSICIDCVDWLMHSNCEERILQLLSAGQVLRQNLLDRKISLFSEYYVILFYNLLVIFDNVPPYA